MDSNIAHCAPIFDEPASPTEPVTSAAAFGYYIFPPINFSLMWDGHDVMWTYEGNEDGPLPLRAGGDGLAREVGADEAGAPGDEQPHCEAPWRSTTLPVASSRASKPGVTTIVASGSSTRSSADRAAGSGYVSPMRAVAVT